MSLESIPLNMDDLVRRYVEGESKHALAEAFGISRYAVDVELGRAGVTIRTTGQANAGRMLRPVDVEALAERYLAGESEKALAEAFGVDRGVVRRRLLGAGIQPRGRSEAMYVRMANTTAEERARLSEAAHVAVRGTKHSAERLIERAKRLEGRITANVSQGEINLAADLRAAGLPIVHQKAVGPYNVDLATGSVAVEVLGGGWHRTKRHGERLRYLMDSGWDVLYVWVSSKTPLGPGAAQYVVSHVEFRNRNPTMPRCYRVIRGSGQFVAEGSADKNDVPDVIPITDRPDIAPAEVKPGFCHCGCGRRTNLAKASNSRMGWVKGEPVRYVSGHNPRRNRNPS